MQKQLERILLSENTKAIEEAIISAKERASKLNEIAPVFEFETEEEFNQRTENIDRLVKSAMMARPDLKKLSQSVELNAIRVPSDILEVKQKLIALIQKHDDLFENISYDGNQWVDDIDKLEAFTESNRIYATGNEITRYEGAKSLCSFLNDNKLGFGLFEKTMFHNAMIEWSIQENCWVVCIAWIKG